MRRDACALIRRPLPSTGLSPASPVLWADLPVRCTQTGPTSPRRSLPLRFPSGSAPAAPARGDGGTSRVPDASRPCVPTAEAPVDARSLSPWRATATAFPAVAYGSAFTVLGISGLVPFTPAVCGFRPTEFLSTLRLGRHRPETQDSVPATGWLAPSPVGLPAHRPDAQVTHWEAPTLPGARNVPYYVASSSRAEILFDRFLQPTRSPDKAQAPGHPEACALPVAGKAAATIRVTSSLGGPRRP